MNDFYTPPRQILAVTDESQSQVALRSAVALAERYGAALQVISCVEPPHDLGIISRLSGRQADELIQSLIDAKRTTIQAILKKVFPDRDIDPVIAFGKAFLEIIRHVSDSDSDFVVKAAEPLSGVNRFLFASTDQHLLRKCPCPVWLQTPTAPVRPKRVLAAVDLDVWDAAEPETLTALNKRVVEVACRIANVPDAEVIALHAWDAVGEGLVWAFSNETQARTIANRYVDEILQTRENAMDQFLASVRAGEKPGPRLIPRLARGNAEWVIEQQCRQLDADVVVLGTVARTGLSGVFIGNTAENIINSLGCPVIAVKPDGFVSPLLPR
jgi:nucleotide-binding universal stress UspA family protein